MKLHLFNYGILVLGAGVILGAGTTTSTAADHASFGLESAGARGGVGATSTSKDIWDSEAFLNFSLPSDWDLGKGWRTWLRLDASAGWLGERDRGGFTGSLGPTLVLSRPPVPLTLEAGTGPRYITEWEFRDKDLGSPFQITMHVGLNLDIGQSWRLSYRFQHMSNGGLAVPNQGLNVHFIGFCYVF